MHIQIYRVSTVVGVFCPAPWMEMHQIEFMNHPRSKLKGWLYNEAYLSPPCLPACRERAWESMHLNKKKSLFPDWGELSGYELLSCPSVIPLDRRWFWSSSFCDGQWPSCRHINFHFGRKTNIKKNVYPWLQQPSLTVSPSAPINEPVVGRFFSSSTHPPLSFTPPIFWSLYMTDKSSGAHLIFFVGVPISCLFLAIYLYLCACIFLCCYSASVNYSYGAVHLDSPFHAFRFWTISYINQFICLWM